MTQQAKCPYTGASSEVTGTSNNDWWPTQFKVDALLHNSPKSDPMGDGFDYAAEFASLDLAELKHDINVLMLSLIHI
jgi:catalase-peroxidase